MNRKDDFELTPAEKAAFESLQSEALPSKSLEERIVRALKRSGSLRDTGAEAELPAVAPIAPASTTWRFDSHQRDMAASRRAHLWLLAAATMVASLAIFAGGIFVGQWMGARSTERFFLAVREQDHAQLAQRVQETGSAYVTALVALEKLRANVGQTTEAGTTAQSAQGSRELQQGREAALGALHGAAIELSRISPGDPHIYQMLQILEEQRFHQTGFSQPRKTVWF